ncbi:MAG: hypothetical protein EOM37_15395 [Proteobacteria bacterium]|nr:hypothetical protein [Pseudomonadota bacterium]
MDFTVSESASRLFSSEFEQLSAMVLKRIELEWRYHRRPDLEREEQQLLRYAADFGQLMAVVYKFGLFSALLKECEWIAGVFAARGSRRDAFAVILDSWIMAILGLLKEPECNELVRPLQYVREHLDQPAEKTTSDVPAFRYAYPDLLKHIVRGDVQRAQNILFSLPSDVFPKYRLAADVLLPSMAEVGRLWELNELEIFQEHLATETMRTLVAGLTSAAPEPALPCRTALVSCAPEDKHDLIPLLLAAHLTFGGWSAVNLGGGLPAVQIARTVAFLRPDALFLTFTMLSMLEGVLDVIDRVRLEFPDCRVILGGRGAFAARELLESRGAFVADDFDEGLRLASVGCPHA